MAIRYDVDGAVVVITIDRPDAMNALDPEHNERLRAAVAGFEADPALAVAVLTGAGEKAFSAGADLKALIPAVRDAARAGQDPDWNLGGLTSGEGSKPLIAAVNGHALAGGLELALACDIRLASPNATFGLAETKWAITPGAGGTVRLPRAVPVGLAMEMILTGDPIDAATAASAGLVNRVVPLEDLRDEAVRLAQTIASRGPLAVRAARRLVYGGLGVPTAQALATEHDEFVAILRTEDAVEGATSFTEKRPPRYHGR